MARRYDSKEAKRRILTACVRLFLEKGYTNTKVAEILKEADVSAGSFQNIFRTKDGVLTELIGMMFSRQFGAVRPLAANAPSPVYLYAVETALQLAMTELSENLRNVTGVQTCALPISYTFPATAEIIHRSTTAELRAAFSAYLPGCAECDFYEMELGTAGMMRGYMARRCDPYFTLERKIRRYLSMSLSALQVPAQEREQVIAFVAEIDMLAQARKVVDAVLASLSVQFDLKG